MVDIKWKKFVIVHSKLIDMEPLFRTSIAYYTMYLWVFSNESNKQAKHVSLTKSAGNLLSFLLSISSQDQHNIHSENR